MYLSVEQLDTPALLIDREILTTNIQRMQQYADAHGVALRPHAGTHKMPRIAKLQEKYGAKGITVYKTSEAEVMARNKINDIFVVGPIAGLDKLRRIRALAEKIHICFGVDCAAHVRQAQEVFTAATPAEVLVEIDVGEGRGGVADEESFLALLKTLASCENVRFKGLYAHDRHIYALPTDNISRQFRQVQERMLRFAALAQEQGTAPEVVSIGSTAPLTMGLDILDGINEIRPGAYALMDASMCATLQTQQPCAATVLASVVSRPANGRVVLDVGDKGLTSQQEIAGSTPGYGTLKGRPDIHVARIFDEYAVLDDEVPDLVVGNKVEILPAHIGPVCNLYDSACVVSGGVVVDEIPIAARGKYR